MAERSWNKVQLLGRVGQDAENGYTHDGQLLTKFSVATSVRHKPKGSEEWKEITEWSNCVLWESERLAACLKKGTHVFLEGRLRTREWTSEAGEKHRRTEIVVSDLVLIGGGKLDEDGAAAAQGGRKRPEAAGARQAAKRAEDRAAIQEAAADGLGITDDDVPF